MTVKPYLTLRRAAEVAEAIRSCSTNIDYWKVSHEEVEQLLAMALDAPHVRARQQRATWSAFEAGSVWGDQCGCDRVSGIDAEEIAATRGCMLDRHHSWRAKFNAEDPEGDGR